MRSKDGLALLVALLVAVALGVLGTSTFAPKPADSDPAGFSAMRAMADVQRIAAKAHPTGSTANAEVRAYLTQRLGALGLTVTEQVSPLSAPAAARLAEWSGVDGPPPPAVSLIGTLPGRDRTLPAVLLMAHHDTVWGSPGAPDDTTGVAAILETVRALAHDGQPARDVIVLFTDAEELGLEGANAFFASNPLRSHVGAVINLEARGGGGRATLFETSRDNGNAVRRYIDVVQRPAGSSLSVFVYKLLPNNTDLTEALGGDYAAYNLAFIGRPGLYHSPLATPARLDKGTVQDIGDQTLALTRELAGPRPLPSPAADIVFFDAFGLAMVHYPAWVGWLLLIVGAGGLTAAALRAPREGFSWWRALLGTLRLIGLAVVTGLVLYGLNAVSGANGPVNYYDRLAALARLEAVALSGALASFVALFASWRGGARATAIAAFPLLLVTIALQATAPTAAYVAVVPFFLVGLGQLGNLARNPAIGRITAGIAAALVTGYMIQFGHQLVQGVGNDLLHAAALPFVFAAFSWLPLWRGLSRRAALMTTAVLLAVAIAIALWVRLDPVAPSAAVYSTFK
jgi:hypothetical protein